MRLAWAFFKRDAVIALSYRFAFVAQFVVNLLVIAVFYYLGRTIGDRPLPALEPYGGNLLAFLLIGIALTDCVTVSLASFAAQLREAQATGTLEATFMSPVPVPVILACSSLWSYFMAGVRFAVYLVAGGTLYGLELGRADLLSAALVFLLTLLSFVGLGILWAAAVLLVKRGESLMTIVSLGLPLVSGALFPVALLPGWMQAFAALSPLTHGLEGMRLAVLRGAAPGELAPLLATLGGFAFALLAAGWASVDLAVRAAKHAGSLTQY